MKFEPTQPPRSFKVSDAITLKDCGTVELSADEQVTFKAEGSEYDFCRKSWGYYASPSLNSRMGRFGLRPALVKSRLNGTFFLMAVLKKSEKQFLGYLKETGQELVLWLDDKSSLESLAPARACICGSGAFAPAFHYDAPPKGEIAFKFSSGKYERDVLRCLRCGHFVSLHAMDMSGMYSGEYVDSTYGAKMKATFDKITALPASKSDNAARVAYVTAYAKRHFDDKTAKHSILDVGSGLCVFLHRMKKEGWKGTALDPDKRAAKHAEDIGVRAVCADFTTAKRLGRFEAIAFNKVLEHAIDPVAMLKRSREFLDPKGFIYVELPDGEGAFADGPGREEFFIDHHHVFSAASYGVLAERAGFRVRELERLREPSGKYTLRGILCPP